MTAYYNEIEPFAAEWLKNLIAAGHIAPGDVDTRSIEDVAPDDLRPYAQCHFFAGIGVWSLALRNAGWPDDRPVWTGSCPCQPFSAAGKGNGFADERHLWPAWAWIITECRPPIIFGEQVASKAVEPWIELVSADLEGMGFTFGTIAFPSASVGAPHIRDRAYWVADTNASERWAEMARRNIAHRTQARWDESNGEPREHCEAGGLGFSDGDGCKPGRIGSEAARHRDSFDATGGVGRMGDTPDKSRERHARRVSGTEAKVNGEGFGFDGSMPIGFEHAGASLGERPGPTNGFWRDADWLLCRDGKWRPVEPGTFPLVDGAPSRVGRLRAYGNAINAEQAKIFIESAM